MHALKAVPLANGGRGQRGGLRAYAERIGKTEQYLSQLRAAAEVAETDNSSCRFLLDKAKHLFEVSRAQREAWPVLVGALVDRNWTVADTRDRVEEVRRFEVPREHQDWLPPVDVIDTYVWDGRPTSRAVNHLVSTANAYLITLPSTALRTTPRHFAAG